MRCAAEARALNLAEGGIACTGRTAAAARQRGVADGDAVLARAAAGHALMGATNLGGELEHGVLAAAALDDHRLGAAAHG